MSLVNAVANVLAHAIATPQRQETPIEAMLRETCLGGNREPDARLKDDCDRLIAAIDYVARLKANRDTTVADLRDAFEFIDECRRVVKCYHRRRFVYRCRRFTIDRTGFLHVCPIQAGEVSPLGRKYGAVTRRA